MATINPYLNFNGNTEEVFNFYKTVFGGEFLMLTRFKDNPGAAEGIPAAEQNGIMHVALPIGTAVLMGTDCPSVMEPVRAGTNISLTVQAESREEADEIFAGLGAGGKIQMSLADMFWGDYFGMLTDKFDIQWMITYHPGESR